MLLLLASLAQAKPLPAFVETCGFGDVIYGDWIWEAIAEGRGKMRTTWLDRSRTRKVEGNFIVEPEACRAVGIVLEGAPSSARRTARLVRLGEGEPAVADAEDKAKKMSGHADYDSDDAGHVFARGYKLGEQVDQRVVDSDLGPIRITSRRWSLAEPSKGIPRPEGTSWTETAADAWDVVNNGAYQLATRLVYGPQVLWMYEVPGSPGETGVVSATRDGHRLVWWGSAKAVPVDSDYLGHAHHRSPSAPLPNHSIKPKAGYVWLRLAPKGQAANQLLGVSADGTKAVLLTFHPAGGPWDSLQVKTVGSGGFTLSGVRYGPIADTPMASVTWRSLGF